jgi:cyclophilin family peptidyl-prolyl cis-trans isomerase
MTAMKWTAAPVMLLTFVACFVCQSFLSLTAQTIVSFETNVGNIDVRLFDDTAPVTVENFLGYVSRGDYEGTLFHRSVLLPGNLSIIQGGGFLTDGSPIPTLPPIINEFGASNIRGTIAMARTSEVNSATSQFFFNTDDNSSNLDNQNEGFTVFGEVISGLEVADTINELPTINANGPNPGPFDDLPVLEPANGVAASNLIVLQSVSITSPVPEPTTAWALGLGSIAGLIRRRRR